MTLNQRHHFKYLMPARHIKIPILASPGVLRGCRTLRHSLMQELITARGVLLGSTPHQVLTIAHVANCRVQLPIQLTTVLAYSGRVANCRVFICSFPCSILHSLHNCLFLRSYLSHILSSVLLLFGCRTLCSILRDPTHKY